jgi:hypothetical protein
VWSCPSYGAPTVSNGQLIVHDIHDGGEKVLTVVGKTILIQPYKNDEKWRVLVSLVRANIQPPPLFREHVRRSRLLLFSPI